MEPDLMLSLPFLVDPDGNPVIVKLADGVNVAKEKSLRINSVYMCLQNTNYFMPCCQMSYIVNLVLPLLLLT